MTTPAGYLRYTLLCSADQYDRALSLLLDLPTAGWQESADGGALTFWLAAGQEGEPAVAALLAGLAALGRLQSVAETDDWSRGWRRFHHVVRVGSLTVRPPWLPPEAGTLDVVIDVGMAFGTGCHQTTRQCLAALQQVPVGSLLDVGTGSGVLAFAALRLGFSPVYACDNDDWALEAAAANAALNGLCPQFFAADLLDAAVELPAADVLVANIALRPIVALGNRLTAAGGTTPPPGTTPPGEPASRREPTAPSGPTSPDGPTPRHLILAGLLESQADEARAAFPDFRLTERAQLDEWVMLRLERA